MDQMESIDIGLFFFQNGLNGHKWTNDGSSTVQRDQSSESISNGEQLENKLLLFISINFFSLKTQPQFALKKNKGCFPMFSRQLTLNVTKSACR